MSRFEHRYSLELQIAIWLSMFLVFAADLRTVLGIAVWVFYIVPILLSLLSWRPTMPILVAAVSTVLIVVGFVTDDPGITVWIAEVNRVFGAVTMCATGILGRQYIKNRLAVAEQDWMKEGHSQLVAGMQGEHLLPALGDSILHFLTQYLGARVGIIFFRSDDGSFERFATYAVQDERTVRERIRPGESLAGQVIKDRHPLLLRNLPANYLRISSALGDATPNFVLVGPGIAEGDVEAIVELGFILPTEPADLRFLELISEPVGMAVRASKYRSRLEALLEETRRQAEELQAQSEELRVTNEELEAQSKLLTDSQARLEAQQSELEQTNAHLEEQAQTLERQKADLTEVQSALAMRAEELSRASQYKSEFLANMSHELRTPLNSSLILAKLLGDNKSGNLTAEQVKFAQTIYAAGNDLLELVNDILDIAKIEAGKVTIQRDNVIVERLVENLSLTFRPIAEQHKLQFFVDIDRTAPASLITDPQRLEQVLRNLLSNAFKFTEKGSVTIRVAAASGDRVTFAVTDTGIGIPEHQHAVIFEAFRQADGSTHRKYGGTGLGLSISQELAKLLGGDIRLESVPGQGSTFTLTVARQLPEERTIIHGPTQSAGIAPPPEPPRSEPAAPPANRSAAVAVETTDDDRKQLRPGGRTLLVIEDDERFARIIYDLAHEIGFQCILATTAVEGLALAREVQPNALVLDMHLPDQSGLYVLDQLKRTPATRHIPVHVVSVEDYTQRARELGAVGYAIKPVQRDELANALQKLEQKLDQPVRRILVVEDDDRQRESIQRLLEGPSVELTAVATAGETLEKLREHAFDCVVMDLGLTDMSGYELLDRMAIEEAYSFPPVIIYTGRELHPLDEQRLMRYSRSIIIKGARSPERLLDEVTLFLHQVESKLPPDQQQMLRMVRDRDIVLEGRRILVVEDDVRNIFAISSILEPQGATIEIARTGKEAITALERSLKGVRIDLVLMDIMMPEMDGLTAMRLIRSRSEFAKVPIIALTAKAMPDDREQCIAAGANDYISKPLDVDKLLSLTRVWMPKA